MSERDDSDSRLDRLLQASARSVAQPTPPDGLADRIVGFATTRPQRKPFAFGAMLRQAFDGVLADWPQGLAYKAAVMLLVAVVTFGGGIGQSLRGASHQAADAELQDVIFGDFTWSL